MRRLIAYRSRSPGLRLWAGVAVLVAATAGLTTLVVTPTSIVGPVLLLVGAILLPAMGLERAFWVLFAGYAVHPLVMRILIVDIGATGLPLAFASTWKEVGLASTVTLAVAVLRVGRTRWKLQPPDFWAATLVVLCTASIAIAPDWALAAGAWRLLVYPIGMYVLVRICQIPAGRLFWGVMIIAGVMAIAGIVQSMLLGWAFTVKYYALPDGTLPPTYAAQFVQTPRAIGTLTSPNEFALFMAFAAMCATAVVAANKRLRPVASATLCLLLVGLGVSISRGAILSGLLGLTAATALYWVKARQREWVSSLAWLMSSVAAAALIVTLVYANNGALLLFENTFRTLASQVVTNDAATASPTPTDADGATVPPSDSLPEPPDPPPDPSTIGHLDSLSESFATLAEHPLGVGLGNVGSRTVPGVLRAPAYISESWYFTMGLSLGWMGLLWAVSLAPMVIVWTLRSHQHGVQAKIALVGLAISAATIGVVLPTLTEPVVAMIFWSALAGAITLNRPSGGAPPKSGEPTSTASRVA